MSENRNLETNFTEYFLDYQILPNLNLVKKYVCRKKELDLLHADLESKKNTAIMIYGRRRIGNGKKHYSEIEASISEEKTRKQLSKVLRELIAAHLIEKNIQ